MLRTTLIAALAALIVVAVSASAQPGNHASKPLASARVSQCLRGPAAENRLALFRGAMRRVPATQSMWMRFKLQERVGEGAFRTIKAPGLGTWRKSRPGVRRFAYRQRVLALAEGSSYRVIVSFRWYDANGEVIRKLRRRSPACRQPGLLANLRVARIGGGKVVPGSPGVYRYAVNVINRGRVATDPFSVRLDVDGATADTGMISALAPGETRRLVLSGPACRGTVTAVADPEDLVREVTERDNQLTVPCRGS
jgi:CARDB